MIISAPEHARPGSMRVNLALLLLTLFYSPFTIRGTSTTVLLQLRANAELCSAWTGEAPVPPLALAVHKLCEHAVRIDGDEQALAAGQDFFLFVQDLSHVDVPPALDLDLA